jgi:CRISPR-associated protein Cmr4
MKATLYSITARTNLHAGSGDANYGIIDKLVQRDPIVDLPVIHASSLKGAILEHFFHQEGMSDAYIDTVFGGQNSAHKRKNGKPSEKSKTGEFVFMQAQLLSIPIRSNAAPFFRCTSDSVLKELKENLTAVGLGKSDICMEIDKISAKMQPNKAISLSGDRANYHLEDEKNVDFIGLDGLFVPKLTALLGSPSVVLHDAMLRRLTDNHHLPVIARNHLENGQSTNLWYEQILPRQTKFYAIILSPNDYKDDFETRLTSNLVQIGANATVGYGYCKFEAIEMPKPLVVVAVSPSSKK